jgi:hypothetical protein
MLKIAVSRETSIGKTAAHFIRMYRCLTVSPNAALRTERTSVETKLKKYSELTVKGCSRHFAGCRKRQFAGELAQWGKVGKPGFDGRLATGVASSASECDDWPFAVSGHL